MALVHLALLRRQPTRQVVGFVTSSVRSQLRRESLAVAFCRCTALQCLLTDAREWCPVKPAAVAGRRAFHVLARNATSNQYIPAILTVCA